MDDALLVGGFKGFGNLPRDRQGVVDGDWPLGDAIRQCRAFNQFEDQRLGALRFFQHVDVPDVRMIQGGEHSGFSLEAGDAIWIGRERLGKHLERNVAVERGVAGAIHFAHTASPERVAHLVRADPCPRG